MRAPRLLLLLGLLAGAEGSAAPAKDRVPAPRSSAAHARASQGHARAHHSEHPERGTQ